MLQLCKLQHRQLIEPLWDLQLEAPEPCQLTDCLQTFDCCRFTVFVMQRQCQRVQAAESLQRAQQLWCVCQVLRTKVLQAWAAADYEVAFGSWCPRPIKITWNRLCTFQP